MIDEQTRFFFDQEPRNLAALCVSLNVPSSHVKTMMQAVYKYTLPPRFPDQRLPSKLLDLLNTQFSFALPKILTSHKSAYDDSVKFALELSDGEQIEMVLMPETQRLTLCISSQVGCAQGCVFCHTGRMGLRRQLSRGEIIGQIVLANQWLEENKGWLKQCRLPSFIKVTNVVFMGMGEPLDNLDAILPAFQIMTYPYALNLPLRKITVSTAGHLDGLKIIARKLPQVRIALSLHSPFEHERSKIMPINRRWPLTEVIAELAELSSKQKHDIFIQYTLIKGINDRLEHAHELCKILHGVKVKFNLIPLNSIDPSRFVAPDFEQIEAFRSILHNAGYRTMIRYSKGQDIRGACGQLVTSQH